MAGGEDDGLSDEERAAVRARAAALTATFHGNVESTAKLPGPSTPRSTGDAALPFQDSLVPAVPKPVQDLSMEEILKGGTMSVETEAAPPQSTPFRQSRPAPEPVAPPPPAPRSAPPGAPWDKPRSAPLGAPRSAPRSAPLGTPRSAPLGVPPSTDPSSSAAPGRDLESAPLESGVTYSDAKSRARARALAALMTTDDHDLAEYAGRQVGRGSALKQPDVVRIRAILRSLGEALKTGDDQARERIYDAWAALHGDA